MFDCAKRFYLPMFQTLVHNRIRREEHQKSIWYSPGKINWFKLKVRTLLQQKKYYSIQVLDGQLIFN